MQDFLNNQPCQVKQSIKALKNSLDASPSKRQQWIFDKVLSDLYTGKPSPSRENSREIMDT